MTHVVTFRGNRLDNIKRGIARAAQRAALENVTPHVLKHTAVTWAIMRGLEVEDVAQFFRHVAADPAQDLLAP